jgi:hypothetical protein
MEQQHRLGGFSGQIKPVKARFKPLLMNNSLQQEAQQILDTLAL